MNAHNFAISAVLLALFGCPFNPSTSNPTDLMGLGNQMFRFGCQTATAVVEKKVINRHEPSVTDTIKTISCDGLEMEIYVSVLASDPSGLPIYLEVRNPDPRLPRYMDIGESVRGLIAVLGKPFEQNDHTVTYYTGESEDSITFSVREGLITSVRWDWYND